MISSLVLRISSTGPWYLQRTVWCSEGDGISGHPTLVLAAASSPTIAGPHGLALHTGVSKYLRTGMAHILALLGDLLEYPAEPVQRGGGEGSYTLDTSLPSPAQLFCIVQIEMLPHSPGHKAP